MTSPLAFITGLGRPNGIAHAIALRLAADGWDIAYSHWPAYDDRRGLAASSAHEISEEIRTTGRRVLALEGDLADPTTPERLLAEARGPIDTGWMTDHVREHLTALQPTGRLGTPTDTADVVSFLLSPKGAWISGQLLKSDGGFSV